MTLFLFIMLVLAGSVFAHPIREQQRDVDLQPGREQQGRAQSGRGQHGREQHGREQHGREQHGRMQHRETQPQNRNNTQRPANIANTVTVEGTLMLQRGIVAVQSEDTVLYIPLLNRYIGFINDLREGTQVSITGVRFRNLIRPSNVTIEGRTYDFITENVRPQRDISPQRDNSQRRESAPQRFNHRRHSPSNRGCGCNCSRTQSPA